MLSQSQHAIGPEGAGAQPLPRAAGLAGAGLPVRVLVLPPSPEAGALPLGFDHCEEDRIPDVVVLARPGAAVLISPRLGHGLAAVIPIIAEGSPAALTGTPRCADVTTASPWPKGATGALATALPLIRRFRQVAPSVSEDDDPRRWLLARLFVRDRGLVPRRTPNVKEVAVYDDEGAICGVAALADDLAGMGLLDRQFFDSLTACPCCGSARLLVRELCGACGSADLCEQVILHHMRCGYQGPEADFRRSGEALTCPKCRRRLDQFSYDYDRPGSMYLCRACGQHSGDPSISFMCLDCQSEVAAGDTATRAVHAYMLNDAGRACMISGAALPRNRGAPDRPSRRIHAFLENRAGGASCILGVRLVPAAVVPPGGRSWQQTCAFFGQMMRECFTQDTEVVEAPPAFFALLAEDGKEAVEAALPEIRRRLERHLARPPETQYRVYGPDELAGLLAVARGDR